VGPNFRIDYPHRLTLGHRIVIGADTRITARDEIVIGDDFLSAPGLCLNTGTHDPVTLVPLSSPITIGSDVWCGAHVIICAGAAVGSGCIVGAGSLVIRDLPDHSIAYGVPARPQRSVARERTGQSLWSNFRRDPEGRKS
jgi:maltose O-acetyltransferase